MGGGRTYASRHVGELTPHGVDARHGNLRIRLSAPASARAVLDVAEVFAVLPVHPERLSGMRHSLPGAFRSRCSIRRWAGRQPPSVAEWCALPRPNGLSPGTGGSTLLG